MSSRVSSRIVERTTLHRENLQARPCCSAAQRLQSARAMQATPQTIIVRGSARGLSLIEILVVLAIIALLTSGIAIYAIGVYEDSKRDTAALEISALAKAADMYQMRKGACPKSAQELHTSGLIDRVKQDPWGADYVFACPGEHALVDIASAGKDGEFGTDDDVTSWPRDQSRASE